MTNKEKIQSMTDEELATVLLCPYDAAGNQLDIMPCIKDGIQRFITPEECNRCMIHWLNMEVRK